MRQVDDAWNEQMRGTENWRKNKWGAADYDALGGAVECATPDQISSEWGRAKYVHVIGTRYKGRAACGRGIAH